jgi:hypothetical protein
MSRRSRHGGSLSDVVHSADEAPADAVGGRSMRPDRDPNRDQTSLVLREISRKLSACGRLSDCDPISHASTNDGVDDAPNGISVPRWSLSKPI